MANNWSNIEENEDIINSDIYVVVSDFDKVHIIGNTPSDVSDNYNNDYTEKPKLSKNWIFQKIADLGGFLKEHGNLKTQGNQLSIF